VHSTVSIAQVGVLGASVPKGWRVCRKDAPSTDTRGVWDHDIVCFVHMCMPADV
jgi:hypothetical protein